MYAFTPICTRNWYDDWSCVECCKGDRCNKYVIVSLEIYLNKILFKFYKYLAWRPWSIVFRKITDNNGS